MDPAQGVQHVKLSKNIYFQTTPDTPDGFLTKVQEAMAKILEGEVGQRLIRKIGEGQEYVTIIHAVDADNTRRDLWPPSGGAGSTIQLSGRAKTMLDANGQEIPHPFFLTVAHELIHAYHNSYGKNKGVICCGNKEVWTNDEEYKTIIGWPSKNPQLRTRPKISENSIRSEHNLPDRFSHHDKVSAVMASHKTKAQLASEGNTHLISTVFQKSVVNPHNVPSPSGSVVQAVVSINQLTNRNF